MDKNIFKLPNKNIIIEHMVNSLSKYWPNDSEQIKQLPIVNLEEIKISIPLKLAAVELPNWAKECTVNNYILVPIESVKENNSWKMVDWWLASFLMLECWHERKWESKNGIIHSYSFRLKEWDKRAWEHAWVNRIGMFLRTWALHRGDSLSESKLGLMDKYDFQMTHDVDAIKKTWAIRIKQGSFNFLNSFRALLKNDVKKAKLYFSKGLSFVISNDGWWMFDELLSLEKSFKIKAIYHFHADGRRKSPKRWLFDPNYAIESDQILQLLKQITDFGHKIGLHPGFDCWKESSKIKTQRKMVEKASNTSVKECRQHWLRFSWEHTWLAQKEAGMKCDRTLMFNDRPGFRNSSALTYHPWNPKSQKSYDIIVQPTILMDSHLYDYKDLNSSSRKQEIYHWISECKKVQGSAAILWHPHTLSKDYYWRDGFEETLKEVTSNA